MTLRLSHKGLILVAVPLAFELVFVCLLLSFLDRAEYQAKRLEHSRSVIAVIDKTRMLGVQLGASLFVYGLSKSPHSHQVVERLSQDLDKSSDSLKALIEEDPEQLAQFQPARLLIQHLQQTVRTTESIIAERRNFSDVFNPAELRSDMQKTSAQINRGLDKIAQLEEAKGITTELEERARRLIKLSLAVGVALNIIMAVALAVYFNKGAVSRLAVLLQNATRLSRGDSLLPAIKGEDEIATLDAAFHDMAMKLEAAARSERAVVETASDVICALDASNCFTRLNPAATRLWGYPAIDLLGNNIESILASDDVPLVLQALQDVQRAGEAESFEGRVRSSKGLLIPMLWSARWSTAENLVSIVVHDLTASHEVERLKHEFITMISHDLKTPLSAIMGTLGLIEQGLYGEINETGKLRVTSAERNCQRLMKLINDLINIERMKSGKLELQLEHVSAPKLIDAAVESVQGFAEKVQVQIISRSCAAVVNVDSKRMIECLVNLLSNAIKFSSAGSKVTADVVIIGDLVEFSVQDEGRGIPPSKLQSIFERFVQVEADHAEVEQGSGLGLAICKAIVEAHGATIGVESEEGKGSRFWIRVAAIGS